MRTGKLVICAAAVAAAVWSVRAEEKATTPQTKPATATESKAKPDSKAQKKELSNPTGSWIPQKAKVQGHIAVTPNQLNVVNNDMIRNSGASDVADLLRRGGWAQVSR